MPPEPRYCPQSSSRVGYSAPGDVFSTVTSFVRLPALTKGGLAHSRIAHPVLSFKSTSDPTQLQAWGSFPSRDSFGPYGELLTLRRASISAAPWHTAQHRAVCRTELLQKECWQVGGCLKTLRGRLFISFAAPSSSLCLFAYGSAGCRQDTTCVLLAG